MIKRDLESSKTQEDIPLDNLAHFLFNERTTSNEVKNFVTKVKLEAVKDLIQKRQENDQNALQTEEISLQSTHFQSCIQKNYPNHSLVSIEKIFSDKNYKEPLSPFTFSLSSATFSF